MQNFMRFSHAFYPTEYGIEKESTMQNIYWVKQFNHLVYDVPLQKNKDQKNKVQKSKFIISSDQKNKSAKQQVAKTTSDRNSKWPKQQATQVGETTSESERPEGKPEK